MFRVLRRLAAIVAAIGLAVAPLGPTFVERWYSNALYPLIQPALTGASNRVPFALFDALVAVLVAWLAWRVAGLVRGSRGRWPMALVRSSVALVAVAAALYVAFLAVWGLNYRRVPLREKLVFDARAISPAAARDLAETSAQRMNALHDAAHAEYGAERALAVETLAAAFGEAQRLVGVGWMATPARPKQSLLDVYFRSAGVDGMTDPFFLETLTVSDLLPFEQPFVVAHEWSHLAGFADESEANFVGWLAAVHGTPGAEYSGWLFLYGQAAAGLARSDRDEVSAELAAGPLRDIRAVADRVSRNVKPAVSMAGWRAYDRYLRANRVEAGTASYAQVVQLVLGTRFGPGWRPQLAGAAAARGVSGPAAE
jgi:hypothetical protein